jgi:hypothetical protein
MDCNSCTEYKKSNCSNATCAKCIVEKRARPSCTGVIPCREAVMRTNRCSQFKVREWDQ